MFKTKPFTLALGGAILLAGAIAINSVTSLSASEAPPTGNYDKEEIGQIVREYLLENPEVIFEAVEIYSREQDEIAQAKAIEEVKSNLATLVSGSTGFAVGASVADADVVVIEFFDYNCGVCRTAYQHVLELPEKNKNLRLVLQELPVVHEDTYDLTVKTMAAPNSDAYVKMHRALMDQPGIVTTASLPTAAQQAGVDFAVYETHLSQQKNIKAIEAKLDTAMQIANDIGLTGTPGFIITTADGKDVRILSGYDEASLDKAIKEIRNVARKG